MPKSVDDWLNEVSYDFTGYEPSEAVLKYINFIQMAGGDELENKTPLVHLKMCEAMFALDKNTAILCHRGIAKTTIGAEFLILYVAAFGEFPGFGKTEFIIYVGDSIENGVKSLRKNIEYRYNSSEFLKKIIPDMGISYIDEDGNESDVAVGRKFTDVRFEFRNLRGDKLAVRLYGAKSGIRGAKEFGKRPTIALIDDIISDEDSRSEANIRTIEDTVHKAIKYALSPKNSKVIWLGTPFNAKDPLYKVVESGAWAVACYPVCERFPCSKEEFRGSWEDRFDYEYVKESYDEAVKLGKVESFNQELMLRVISTEDRLVNDGDIVWFDREKVIKNRENFNFYITTDLATSTKNGSDYSVISVWAYSSNNNWMLVEGMCKKQEVDKSIDMIFKYASLYNPLGVGIEVSGQQKGFVSWIQQEMIKRNIFFNLLSSSNNGEAGIRPIGDKFSRFHLFVPQFKQKKVWIANQMENSEWGNEFKDEISKVSIRGFKSKHDDVLDTISMLGAITAYAPSSYLDSTQDEDDLASIRNTMF